LIIWDYKKGTASGAVGMTTGKGLKRVMTDNPISEDLGTEAHRVGKLFWGQVKEGNEVLTDSLSLVGVLSNFSQRARMNPARPRTKTPPRRTRSKTPRRGILTRPRPRRSFLALASSCLHPDSDSQRHTHTYYDRWIPNPRDLRVALVARPAKTFEHCVVEAAMFSLIFLLARLLVAPPRRRKNPRQRARAAAPARVPRRAPSTNRYRCASLTHC
jgi:hypothetical protein